jgi:hypothetical protein
MASNIPTLKAPPPVIGLPAWTANPTRRGLADITGTLFRRAGSPETRAEAALPPERLSLPHLIKIGCPSCQSRFLIRSCRLSRTRSRLPHEAHEKVFGWVLKLVAKRGLVKGERIGVDGSTMEANAALRTLEIPCKILLEYFQSLPIHSSCAVIGLYCIVCFVHSPLFNPKRLVYRTDRSHPVSSCFKSTIT